MGQVGGPAPAHARSRGSGRGPRTCARAVNSAGWDSPLRWVVSEGLLRTQVQLACVQARETRWEDSVRPTPHSGPFMKPQRPSLPAFACRPLWRRTPPFRVPGSSPGGSWAAWSWLHDPPLESERKVCGLGSESGRRRL